MATVTSVSLAASTKAMLGVLAACAFATQSVAAKPSPWEAERWLSFGDPDHGWMLVEAHSHAVRRLSFPEPFRPFAIASVPSGRDVFFTAKDPALGNISLFRWTPPEAPVRIGDSRGFHSDPSPTPDGEWVYFSHNPEAGSGAMGAHQPQAFAQIYRVRRDGRDMAALTAESGCHIASNVGLAGLLFVHTDCRVRRWLEMRPLTTPEKAGRILATADQVFDEPSFSPDGKRLLLSVLGRMNLSITERVLRGEASAEAARVLTTFDRTAARARPQYGATPSIVLYQSRNAVWSLSDGTATRLVDINGEG